MATPTVKLVPIELDRTRHLRVDLGSLVEAEDATGKDLMNGGLDKISFRDLRALAFAFLRHEDPELTVERVGSMLHPGNLSAFSDALQRALDVATRSDAPATVGAEGEAPAQP